MFVVLSMHSLCSKYNKLLSNIWLDFCEIKKCSIVKPNHIMLFIQFLFEYRGTFRIDYIRIFVFCDCDSYSNICPPRVQTIFYFYRTQWIIKKKKIHIRKVFKAISDIYSWLDLTSLFAIIQSFAYLDLAAFSSCLPVGIDFRNNKCSILRT